MSKLLYSTEKPVKRSRRRIGEHRQETIKYFNSLSKWEQLCIKVKIFEASGTIISYAHSK